MDNKDRSFTIIYITTKSKGKKSKTQGRYISKTPLGAAKKAFNRECRTSKIKGRCSMLVILKETTKGSKNDIFRYKIRRRKLQKPIKIMKDGKEITIRYKVEFAKSINRMVHRGIKKLKGGGKMDVDETPGVYTGYYNIIGFDTILHTDYFMIPKEKSDKWIIKQILKKHKKDFKKEGVENISIELFDTMSYPKSESPKDVKEALEVQLPFIREEVQRLDTYEIKQKKRDAFDLSELGDLLDKM